MGRVLVTGGAGFVGANVAVALAHDGHDVVAFDNLKRRGSELNLPRLRDAGVAFAHADVRNQEDLLDVETVDAIVEASAEPSVLAGTDGSPDYLVRTNLLGAYHCLELARRDGAQVVFLSTSRVYPVEALSGIRLREGETRFEIEPEQDIAGISPAGVAETLPMDGVRTMYGATKLAAEHLVTEYRSYGVRTVINRCGVIAGPWQMGKVDQGVFTFWLLWHRLRRPLSYIGYGGTGKQVRDLIHVDDLVDLIRLELGDPDGWDGEVANVGGGIDVSLSLRELTALCAEITGNEVPAEPAGHDRPGDVPLYISDCGRLFARTDWRPQRSARQILEDIDTWISENERAVVAALG